MTVYRITLAKWAGSLSASGRSARWNNNGYFMVYTASTRALACLENMVHRRSIGADDLFKVTLIEIPNNVTIRSINRKKLPVNWKQYIKYTSCQQLGDKWLDEGKSAVLKVPSAIINAEFNFLLNPNHPDFLKIKVQAVENFIFDERLFNVR